MHESPRKLSELLEDTISRIKDSSITLKELSEELGVRSYGVLILILTLPNFIPGLATLSGLLLLMFAVQMILGSERLFLPSILGNIKLQKRILEKALLYSKPYLDKIEGYLKPRFSVLSSKIATRFIGIIVALFAFVICLPMPFSNLIPSLALAFMACGLLQKDGLVVFISAISGTLYCLAFLYLFSALLQSFVS